MIAKHAYKLLNVKAWLSKPWLQNPGDKNDVKIKI